MGATGFLQHIKLNSLQLKNNNSVDRARDLQSLLLMPQMLIRSQKITHLLAPLFKPPILLHLSAPTPRSHPESPPGRVPQARRVPRAPRAPRSPFAPPQAGEHQVKPLPQLRLLREELKQAQEHKTLRLQSLGHPTKASPSEVRKSQRLRCYP